MPVTEIWFHSEADADILLVSDLLMNEYRPIVPWEPKCYKYLSYMSHILTLKDDLFDEKRTLEKDLDQIKGHIAALSGDVASSLMGFLKVGDTVEFRCDISIDGDASKPILTLDSTMYQLMTGGQDASSSTGTSSNLYTSYEPKTFPVVSADRKKVWLVEVDGRQISPTWYSLGVKGYEMYRIGKKLGGAWVTGLDGGGSSAIWVWNPSKNSGKIENKPCDSKGERSCMTYILIREKQ